MSESMMNVEILAQDRRIKKLKAERDNLATTNAALVAALRSVEWVHAGQGYVKCPACKQDRHPIDPKFGVHRDGCTTAAAIAQAEAATEKQ